MSTHNLTCLQIHNDYLIPGGETKSATLIGDVLERNGIIVFRYYVSNKGLENASLLGKAKVGIRSLYNKKTVDDIERILETRQISFALVHNTTPVISNSIYDVLIKHGVPIYKYLQNYNLICLNGAMDHAKVCEACKLHPLKGISHRCYRSSSIYSLQKYISNKILWRKYISNIDGFIAISEFVKGRHVERGIPEKKIHVLYHFCEAKSCVVAGSSSKPYFVYMGRLSREKGIMTLVKAMQRFPMVELKILGKGDMEDEITQYIKSSGIHNIEMLGYKQGVEKDSIVGNAVALIAPSEWEEPFGRIAIEAYQVGTPVIASAVGGLKELISEGKTGYLFESGNMKELVEALQKILALSQAELMEMRGNCVEAVNERFSEEAYFQKFMQMMCSAGYLPAENVERT